MLKTARSLLRTAAKGQLLSYAGGRIYAVRTAHGMLRSFGERIPAGRPNDAALPTLFPGVDIEGCVESLRRDAVALDLSLPPEYVEEIRAFAERRPCIRPHLVNRATPLGVRADERFSKRDVTAGRLPDGQPAPMALVIDAEQAPAVARLVNDPLLLEVARRFLRFRPPDAGSSFFGTSLASWATMSGEACTKPSITTSMWRGSASSM